MFKRLISSTSLIWSADFTQIQTLETISTTTLAGIGITFTVVTEFELSSVVSFTTFRQNPFQACVMSFINSYVSDISSEGLATIERRIFEYGAFEIGRTQIQIREYFLSWFSETDADFIFMKQFPDFTEAIRETLVRPLLPALRPINNFVAGILTGLDSITEDFFYSEIRPYLQPIEFSTSNGLFYIFREMIQSITLEDEDAFYDKVLAYVKTQDSSIFDATYTCDSCTVELRIALSDTTTWNLQVGVGSNSVDSSNSYSLYFGQYYVFDGLSTVRSYDSATISQTDLETEFGYFRTQLLQI